MVSRTFPLRLLVGSDMVGAIIGRSGSTIRAITVSTKARIDVHRGDNQEHSEKVITISGTPESCSEACFKIIEIIQNEKSAKHDNFGLTTNSDITLKILAPSAVIGRLIGKNGTSIKKMMEQTSTKISISVNDLTGSTGDHYITVVGRLEYVLQAEKLISAKLRAAYASDMQSSIQTMSQQPYLFNNVPLPYVSNPYAQNYILSSLVNPSSSKSVSRNLPPLTAAHQGYNNQSMYSSIPSYLPVYPNLNQHVPSSSGLLGFNPLMQGIDYEREIVYIYIPVNMVGAIIGKSGSAIKEMISTSGASIKVATTPLATQVESLDQSSNEHQNEGSNVKPDHAGGDGGGKSVVNMSSPTSGNHSKPNESHCAPDVHNSQSSMNQKEMSGHSVSGTNDDQNISTRRVTIVGYPTSQYSAQYMIYRKISSENGKKDASLMVEISVPSPLVGRIIGKAGAVVKQLQKQTRTLIRLSDDKTVVQSSSSANADSSSGDSETIVQITGEFEGSQAAQRHIRNLIRGNSQSSRSSQSKSLQNRNNSVHYQVKGNSNSNNNNNNNNNNNHAPYFNDNHQNENGMAVHDKNFSKDSYVSTKAKTTCGGPEGESESISCGCYQSSDQGVNGEDNSYP